MSETYKDDEVRMVYDKTGTRSNKPTEMSPRAMQILGATEELLAERGPDAVSMRDIAQRAGVNKALIFYYFGSRGELLDKVQSRYAQDHKVVVDAAAKAGDAKGNLLAVLDAYMDFFDTKGELYARLIHHELARKHAGLEGLREDIDDLYKVFAAAASGRLDGTGAKSAPQCFASLLALVAGSYSYPGALAAHFAVDPSSSEGRAERRAHVKWVAETMLEDLLG